jgi:hypothetical protein
MIESELERQVAAGKMQEVGQSVSTDLPRRPSNFGQLDRVDKQGRSSGARRASVASANV